MDDLRKEKRAPILLKVKYKSASVDEFIQQSGLDISRGGIFIKTKTPMDIGTVLKFEFQLSDGAPVIHGVGRVAWRRDADVATRDLPPGMGVKFIKLDPESRTIVDRTVSQRGTSPSRYDAGDEEPSGPQAAPIAPVATEPTTATRAAVAAAAPSAPAAPAATARAAASAMKSAAGSLPLPPTAKPGATGARPAPPGVFSAPTKAPAPTAAPGAFASAVAAPAPARARDSASGRSTVPSLDPFADAEAPSSFFPKGPPAPSPATEDSTQVRHVSEFLASVMNEAGATDQSIAAEAQATAQKARVREHQVEEQRLAAMEAQLFGDMGEQTASVPLRPVSLSPKAAVEKDFDPFASEPPRGGSPELAPSMGRAPSAAPLPSSGPSMQASLAPSTKEAVTGRQQGFGAAQASASEAKFPAPEMPKPVLALSGQDVPSLPPPKKSSNAWLPLVVVALLLGGGAYWYFQLGGAQTIAGGEPAPIQAAPEPTPAPQAPTEPSPSPTPGEPVAAAPTEPTEATPTEPTPTEPTPTEPAAQAAPAAMVEVQVTSTPKDATFSIDGVEQGKTPKRVQLPVGRAVNVTVSAFGYKPMTQAYTVLPKNDPLRFKLETMSFVLTVRTMPSDAHVTVRNLVGDNAQPMDLGFLAAPVTVTVMKAGFTKKQKQVTPGMFVEQNGVMVAGIEVGLRRPGATVDGDVPVTEAPEPTPSEPAEATPAPRPVVAEPAPAPTPTPEPEAAPRPTPKPEPKPEPAAPALPDNPF